MAYEATPFDTYTTYGLDEAKRLQEQSKAQGLLFAPYTPSQANAPTQQPYFNYQPVAPLQTVQTPSYNQTAGQYVGLMGGDYNQLQTALQQPGEIAATTAYNQGQTNLQNQMGNRGLYGSSVMANQARNALDTPYQNALQTNAAQAAATRYGMEQTGLMDMNKFNLSREQELNKYGAQMTDLQRQQNADIWRTQGAEADRSMQYGQGQMNWNQSYQDLLRNWQNQQNYEKYQYQQSANQAQNAYQESLMNKALAISGQGAPLASAAQQAMQAEANRQTQWQIAQQNADTANQAGWLGFAGTLGGGLLGNVSYQNGTLGLGTPKK